MFMRTANKTLKSIVMVIVKAREWRKDTRIKQDVIKDKP